MPLHLISVDIRLWETGKQGEKALCLLFDFSRGWGCGGLVRRGSRFPRIPLIFCKFWTEVPYRRAMVERVSPDLTLCVPYSGGIYFGRAGSAARRRSSIPTGTRRSYGVSGVD